MSNFKTTKPRMYCTPMDVRSHLDILARHIADDDDDLKSKQDIPDAKIEDHIYKAGTIAEGYLMPVYGLAVLARETPYFKGPIPAKDNRTSVELMGIVVAATAITEQWLVVFTADDAYKVYGRLSGYQGSGTLATDFIATNLDIQIKIVDWLNVDGETVQKGNQFLVSTYIAHPLVSTIVSMLAAGTIIDAVYSETESDSSAWGTKIYDKAIRLLKDLADESNPMSLTATTVADDRSTAAVGYNISKTGDDVTPYETIAEDVLPDYQQ